MRVRSARILSIVAVLSIISGCLSICDARPAMRNLHRRHNLHADRETSTSTTEKPTGSGPTPPISAGLVVAVFVLVLGLLILVTCVCIWVVGKCRNIHRNEAWNEVYDSLKPFPSKKTRFLSDDDDETNWRGPPPFEINILIPESSISDREINGLAHLDDPTTRMGQVDDAAAISPHPWAVEAPKTSRISEIAKADDVQGEDD